LAQELLPTFCSVLLFIALYLFAVCSEQNLCILVLNVRTLYLNVWGINYCMGGCLNSHNRDIVAMYSLVIVKGMNEIRVSPVGCSVMLGSQNWFWKNVTEPSK
jgi:hypothetical protein